MRNTKKGFYIDDFEVEISKLEYKQFGVRK